MNQKIYTPRDIFMLKRKLAKLEKKYDKADGKPLRQARILKSAMSVQNTLDALGV